MKRAAIEKPLMKNRQRYYCHMDRAMNILSRRGDVPELNRFRKRKPFASCGKPHCPICHGDKYPKRQKTRQEIKAELEGAS